MSALQVEQLPLFILGPAPAELTARLAAFGWRLEADGAEWCLLGNGAPAWFYTLSGVADWLSHQQAPRRPRAARRVAGPTDETAELVEVAA